MKPFQLNPIYHEPAFPITWDDYGLLGKPKEILTSTFHNEVINGKIEQYCFNLKGLLIESNELFPSKKLYKQELYQYNQDNKLIRIKESNSSGSLLCQFTFQYNHAGLLSHYQCIEYGQVDHIIEEKKLEYFCSSNGVLEKVIQHLYASETEFHFNQEGKIDYCQWHNENNQILKRSFSYDSHSISSQTQNVENGQIVGSRRVFFDESNRILKRVHLGRNDELRSEEQYQYDQFGNRVEERTYIKDEPYGFNQFSYSYDEYNNWIEKRYLNLAIQYTRTIKYFE